jgi:hypothetical protein
MNPGKRQISVPGGGSTLTHHQISEQKRNWIHNGLISANPALKKLTIRIVYPLGIIPVAPAPCWRFSFRINRKPR